MTEATFTSLYGKKLTVRPPSSPDSRHYGKFQVDLEQPDGSKPTIRGALYTKEDAIKLIAAIEDICNINPETTSREFVSKEQLVTNTFDFPQGCDDQKRTFLRTFGIDDPESFLPKPHKIVLEAQYRDYDDSAGEGLNCANFDGAPFGLANVYKVIELKRGPGSWSTVEFTIKDAAKLIGEVGFGPFEVKDGGDVWLRGQLKLDGIR